jgi:hypothetical protein
MRYSVSHKGNLSHVSDGTKCVFRGRRYTAPFGSWNAGHDTAAAPGGETMALGEAYLVGRTAGLCGLPTLQGIGPDQLYRPTEKSNTHGEGSVQLPRTEGNSRPRHTWVAEAAVALRLGPTVYELCSSRLKDSSVTSVTVQRAFFEGGGVPPRRLGDGGARKRSRP